MDVSNELITKTPGKMRIEIGEMLPSVISPHPPDSPYESQVYSETPFNNSRMTQLMNNPSLVTEQQRRIIESSLNRMNDMMLRNTLREHLNK